MTIQNKNLRIRSAHVVFKSDYWGGKYEYVGIFFKKFTSSTEVIKYYEEKLKSVQYFYFSI